MDKSEFIKEQIFEELKNKKLSKEKFAEMVGCHWQTVYRWAQGGRISVEIADKALKVLGVTVKLGATDEKRSEHNRGAWDEKETNEDW